MVCPKCGKNYREGVKFCGDCGTKLAGNCRINPPKDSCTGEMTNIEESKIREAKARDAVQIKRIGLLLLVVILFAIFVAIGVNKLHKKREVATLVINEEDISEMDSCKYDECAKKGDKEGYCARHFYEVQGNDIISDIKNGVTTCRYSNCTNSSIYSDGYCEEHYSLVNGDNSLN